MSRTIFEYEVTKPDQSVIEINKGYGECVGRFIWDDRSHIYNFLGDKPIDHIELKEVLRSLCRLNKRSTLPRWLEWGSLQN